MIFLDTTYVNGLIIKKNPYRKSSENIKPFLDKEAKATNITVLVEVLNSLKRNHFNGNVKDIVNQLFNVHIFDFLSKEDYKKAAAKGVGAGAAGAGLGVAVVALGPTAAMGVATTFGVASTGTAIAALHGAAATNAALAWLGGGALSLGGGGMAAGEAFLAMAGPVGWAIAGAALLSSGLLFWKANADKKRIDNIFTLISKRDVKSYSLAVVELEERIDRIKDESGKLNEAITIIRTFGTDYEKMSEAQQYELGGYLNLMLSSTQLLTNPILGLQPKYTEKDFQQFCSKNQMKELLEYPVCRNVVVSLANLLYKIDLDSKDRKVLWKTLRKNKNMLKAFDMKKKDFDYSFFEITSMALEYKYNN